MWMMAWAPVLANADDNVAAGFLAFFAAMWGIACGMLLLGLGLMLFICFFLAGCLKALPEAHRKQQPGMVFLLLLPLFNIVWGFFVYPKIAESFKSYFDSIGRTDVGDCGKSLALAYCIIVCCAMLPYVGWFCASFIAFVVLLIVLVKFAGLKKLVREGGGGRPRPVLPAA